MKIRNVFLVAFSLLPSLLIPQTPNESLVIGPGDLVHIQVFDTPELEEHVRITDSGQLPLVVGGSVKVLGLSANEAARAIEERLLSADLMKHPQVLLTIEDTATHKVSIIGEVRQPGMYPLPTPRTIVDVLALAGGLTELADRRLLIKHQGSTEKVNYFFSNSAVSALDSAVSISPGDTIVVPKAGLAYALGDVAHPGGYTMTNNEANLSVLQLIARAGGTPPTAVPSHARLIRRGEKGYIEIPLPLSDMQKGKRADMALQPDDVVYVPFSYWKNFAVSGSGIAASAASAAVYRF